MGVVVIGTHGPKTLKGVGDSRFNERVGLYKGQTLTRRLELN